MSVFKPLKFIDQNEKDGLFITTVRKRVDMYFEEHHLSKKYNKEMIVKTIILLSAYIIPFIIYLFYNPDWSSSILLWCIMAFGMAGIGMSIMHDANHGAYSSNPKVNQMMGLTINLAGAGAFNWKIQHNILHHTYTNITHYDDDIDDKAILKLSPHTQVKWYHRYQHIYAFFFYAIMTIYWTFAKDFIQLRKYTEEGHNRNNQSENKVLWLKLIFMKLMYFFIFFIVPVIFFQIPFYKTFICFLIMHLITGLVLTIVFQLAHTVVGTEHPLPNKHLEIENNWAIHQMHTTMNFATKNKLITWYVGGLNYQIEHHLFPNTCHVHYPKFSKIVEKTAEEFSIPYKEYTSFTNAILSHIKALKKFGKMNVYEI